MKKKLFFKIILFFLISHNQLICKDFIILQSTTSARDSGLYDFILPDFFKKTQIDVRVVAVGTGQAIKNAERCDADVLIAHHKESEQKFLDEGYGVSRREFMYNDFVLIGPDFDPGNVKGSHSIISALKSISNNKINFISRGDDSGTHKKEVLLWSSSGIKPNPRKNKWYLSVGQSMGGAINIAVNKEAYILSDRSTWLSFKNKKNHVILVENEPLLYNYYGVIPVSPKKCPDVKFKKANIFIDWLISPETMQLISSYEIGGQQLFFPTN
ncbi:MAG: sulfate transporter [Rickettsiales bacterium]|nr:sulfate transporter [Rickettsiales bacterium]